MAVSLACCSEPERPVLQVPGALQPQHFDLLWELREYSSSFENSARSIFNLQAFMAIRDILVYPDERLHTVAKSVDEVTPEIRQLVDDMAETMYVAPGVGLAATQVDVHLRVIVIDLSEDRTDLKVFINPEIIEAEGEAEREEGCLSVPGIYERVRRYARVKVRALDCDGKRFELKADDLLAVCIQHEMDHLEGKVFVEYLSQLKQNRIRTKLRKRGKVAA
jgi:peptide deformylase